MKTHFLILLLNIRSLLDLGRATKGIMILYHLLRIRNGAARLPEGIVDINPTKQNKYSAGKGIKIFSPESFLSLLKDDDTIFIANPAYEVEVAKFIEVASSKKVTIDVLSYIY